MVDESRDKLARWQLILGRYAKEQLSIEMSNEQLRIEATLEFLYGKEYSGRGVRRQPEKQTSLDPSQLSVPRWIGEVRELFPKEAVEVIERHALDRYKLTELVTDAEVLQKLEPSMELLQTILTFRGLMKEKDVLEAARKIVKQVVEQLKKRFESEIRRTLWGRANRMRHSPAKVTQNFDWRKTIKRNLKNYSLEKKVLVAEKLSFFSRIEQRLPWHIIISVDQSGSMAESVIHSAVMASILSSLPSLGIKLLVFDTSIVDLSQHIDDPVEVLMSVQLGGGTDISQAVKYCETLINNPHRTIFVLISDFCEGGSVKELLATVSRLSQSGVKLLGLAALNETSIPSYDGTMARRLSEVGMEIAALTPMRFAEWLAKAIS